MAKRPPDDDQVNDGSTAFVRLEDVGEPKKKSSNDAPPPRRAPQEQSAPKKGLQVTLPDDEPPPPPKPKPKPVAAAPGKKGRRGNWWDKSADKLPDDEEETAPGEPAQEEPPPEPEPSADDAAGATAFLKVEAPPPPPKRKRPAPEPEPAADDGRTQFYRPDDKVLSIEAMKERPRPAPVAESALPWKLVLTILGVGLLVVLIMVAIVYREGIFKKKPVRHAPASIEKSTDE